MYFIKYIEIQMLFLLVCTAYDLRFIFEGSFLLKFFCIIRVNQQKKVVLQYTWLLIFIQSNNTINLTLSRLALVYFCLYCLPVTWAIKWPLFKVYSCNIFI